MLECPHCEGRLFRVVHVVTATMSVACRSDGGYDKVGEDPGVDDTWEQITCVNCAYELTLGEGMAAFAQANKDAGTTTGG